MYATYGTPIERDGGVAPANRPGAGGGRGTPARTPLVISLQREVIDGVVWPLAHDPHAPGTAREITAAFLGHWHAGQEIAETALLVVSELVTNAVEHAQPPLAVHFSLELDWQLRVEVADRGPAPTKDAWTATGEADEHGAA